MGFWDSLGDYMEHEAAKAQKGINKKFKEKLRGASDKEVERIYRNRYNNENIAFDAEKMEMVEKEARRRGIC